MSNFPTNFPFGKSAFIWNISSCLGGSIDAIIQKCVDNGITSVFIKTADGNQVYPNGVCQLTPEITQQFHARNIKVFGWGFNYGADVQGETDVALYSLEQLGIDGYVFDAESAYESLSNPAVAATQMLTAIRAKHPDALLGYCPYPIISDHLSFPYTTFNQYCNFVMPQVYYLDWQMTPQAAVAWMYSQWSQYEKIWAAQGAINSNIPIVPVASFYDNNDITPPYTLNPVDIAAFYQAAAGYMAVCFWVFDLVIRPDCWNAIQAANVNPPSSVSDAPTSEQNQQQTVSSTTPVVTPATTTAPSPLTEPTTFTQAQLPADIFNSMNGSVKSYNGQEVTITINSDGTRTLTPYTAQTQVQEQSSPSQTTDTSSTPTATPSATPATPITATPVSNPFVVASKGKTTITVKKDPTAPSGVSVKVHDKVLIDYIEEFFNKVFHRG